MLIVAASLQWPTGAAQEPPATRVAAVDSRVSESAPVTEPARPAARHAAGKLSPEAANELLAIAHRTADASNAGALFAPKSWYTPPPPPAQVAPAPAAAPTAPPLPFTFLGRYTDGNDATVYFVTRDDRVYDVKPGDSIDTLYSVESADATQLVFLYKPLNTRQSLPTGDSP